MKRMKKWMACFLAASMALSAAACGKGDESKEQTVSESNDQGDSRKNNNYGNLQR